MYTQEQYDALLAVCKSYRQDVERLEEVIADINELCRNCKKVRQGVCGKVGRSYIQDGYK